MMQEGGLRFLLDEHIPSSVLAGLRKALIDVTSVDELQVKGMEDEQLLSLAERLNRVIVTQDADFVALADAGNSHSGIVFVPGTMTTGELVRAVCFISSTSTPEQMRNRIEFASNYRHA